jgi:hypothetical protein
MIHNSGGAVKRGRPATAPGSVGAGQILSSLELSDILNCGGIVAGPAPLKWSI